MQGKEMREIRHQLRLDRLQFARLLGYTGTDRNNDTRIRKYENDRQQIPLYIARLAWLVLREWDGTGQLPVFPEWPGYEFDHTPDPGHIEETDDAA